MHCNTSAWTGESNSRADIVTMVILLMTRNDEKSGRGNSEGRRKRHVGSESRHSNAV